MKIKVIACEVMQEEIQRLEPIADRDYEFVSMDFHLYPQKLKVELQRIIDASQDYQQIILAFGLCGGAASGLISKTSELIIPRVHDCISIFLSSDKCSACDFKKELGTFYLSNGWMITEKTIISDYQRILNRLGEKKAKRMLERMYDGYNKVLFIETTAECQEEVIEQSKEIATLFGAEYLTVKGETAFIKKIIAGPWDDLNFIKVPPLGEITEEDFGINKKN
nr:DUF1638 domain-containing protein [uncultured Acetobacterium sp.]